MNLLTALARILIFPGLLFAVPAAWLALWIERKAVATMQQRMGPPLLQPFFDFVKLLAKEVPQDSGVEGLLMRMWPILSASAGLGAVGLLPILPATGGFQGDLVLLIALLELPPICMIAAGFSSRSLFGQIGSAREAVLTIAYNLLFLLAILSIAATQHTFRLDALAQLPVTPLRYLCLLAMGLCIPAKLHVNPFSLPNAEQEIYSGPMVEYAGVDLALWQLSHGLEWVATCGLLACLTFPQVTSAAANIAVWLAVSVLIILALSVLAAGTARIAIDTTVRFYWQCTIVFACLILIAATSSSLFQRVH